MEKFFHFLLAASYNSFASIAQRTEQRSSKALIRVRFLVEA